MGKTLSTEAAERNSFITDFRLTDTLRVSSSNDTPNEIFCLPRVTQKSAGLETYRSEIDEAVPQRHAIGFVPLRWLPHLHQECVGKDLGGGCAGEDKEPDHRE